MDINRLTLGERIAAASGVLLLIVMFLNWFGISEGDLQAGDLSGEEARDLTELALSQGLTEDSTSLNVNAWESFSFIDIILLLGIIAAVGFAVAKAASQSPRLPVPSSAIIAGLGILGTLLVLYRIIDPPYSLNREIFVFVGLILAAGIAYGGFRAMQEEGTSFKEIGDNLGDRGGPGAGGSPGGGTGAPPPPASGGTAPPPPPPPPSSNV